MSNQQRLLWSISGEGHLCSYNTKAKEYCWPVLDFVAIGQGGCDTNMLGEDIPESHYEPGNFNGPTRLTLEKLPRERETALEFRLGTISGRKIPTRAKNVHRVFWGMKPLKESIS